MNNSEQHEAIELLENKTAYTQSELLALAQRDKNTKRKFLLVNRKQGKHLAAAPAEVLALFAQLGQSYWLCGNGDSYWGSGSGTIYRSGAAFANQP